MKSYTRREVVGLLGLAALATVGCAEDNESEAEKLRKTAGDPGPADPKSKPDAPGPTPKTQEDMMPKSSNPYEGAGYPGAKSQPKKN